MFGTPSGGLNLIAGDRLHETLNRPLEFRRSVSVDECLIRCVGHRVLHSVESIDLWQSD
jgi:hypothetical protein